MLLYRYDVDLVSLHKFLRKPYLRLRLLLLKKDDNSDKAEEEIEEELKRTSDSKKPCYKGINGIVFDVGMLIRNRLLT